MKLTDRELSDNIQYYDQVLVIRTHPGNIMGVLYNLFCIKDANGKFFLSNSGFFRFSKKSKFLNFIKKICYLSNAFAIPDLIELLVSLVVATGAILVQRTYIF